MPDQVKPPPILLDYLEAQALIETPRLLVVSKHPKMHGNRLRPRTLEHALDQSCSNAAALIRRRDIKLMEIDRVLVILQLQPADGLPVRHDDADVAAGHGAADQGALRLFVPQVEILRQPTHEAAIERPGEREIVRCRRPQGKFGRRLRRRQGV